MKKFFLTTFLFVSLFSLVPEVSFAGQDSVKPYDPLKIFYFREGKNARASLFAHGDAIEVLAPQSYSFGTTGDLKGGIAQDILDFTKINKIKVMPLITNTAFNKVAAHAFLDSTKEQDKAIQAMVKEAKKNNYWGWQVDFEQVGVEYKEEFSHFIEMDS
jgi:spore germination protein YaaH